MLGYFKVLRKNKMYLYKNMFYLKHKCIYNKL